MSVKHVTGLAALAVVSGLGLSTAHALVNIPTVPIGHPGNPADANGFGAVPYTYKLGTTEVTNAQYTAFLNAVAADDAFALYNTGMAGAFGGIVRAGAPGAYTYNTVGGRADHPVNFVNFFDAARFANWLHNGQPSGPQGPATTEDGAYTLTRDSVTNNTFTRNPGAIWAVASESEWIKAAWYQPASEGGDVDSYWRYPTQSNTPPAVTLVNYDNVIGNTTPVGSYSANFYGAFDMGGNVFEWNEEIIEVFGRGARGGAFSFGDLSLRNDVRSYDIASGHWEFVGFRVVQIPEPSSLALLAVAPLATLRRRR